MIHYLSSNPFETDESKPYKCCIKMELIQLKELMFLKVISVNE